MSRCIVALALLAGLASPALAQGYAIDKGAWVLDGTVSLTSQGGELYENSQGDRLTSLSLAPSVLYFVVPGLAIGGSLNLGYAAQGDNSATTIGVGPEIAYFFGAPESTVYPFVDGSVGYFSLNTEGADASGITFEAGAGIAAMLSPSVALIIQATYNIANVSVDQVNETFSGNQFGLQMGVAAFLF